MLKYFMVFEEVVSMATEFTYDYVSEGSSKISSIVMKVEDELLSII